MPDEVGEGSETGTDLIIRIPGGGQANERHRVNNGRQTSLS